MCACACAFVSVYLVVQGDYVFTRHVRILIIMSSHASTDVQDLTQSTLSCVMLTHIDAIRRVVSVDEYARPSHCCFFSPLVYPVTVHVHVYICACVSNGYYLTLVMLHERCFCVVHVHRAGVSVRLVTT